MFVRQMKREGFFISNKYWIIRHGAFWILMYLEEFLSLFGLAESVNIYYFIFGFMADVLMVYFNLYILIPQFFEKNKISTYIFWTLFSLAANMVVIYFNFSFEYGDDFRINDIFYSLLFTLGLLGLAVAIKIAKNAYLKQQKFHELQQLQLTTELNYLKKQVNPHFLFNVLNTMYVQAKEYPEDVPETILKLSDLMRYQTYDAAHETVRLNQELDFIKQYLALEKMRRNDLTVGLKIKGSMDNISIPPLLFLPFVENACKYSQSISSENEQIHLLWELVDRNLIFKIENTFDRSYVSSNDDYSGMGLENIQKRMQLLYPKRHILLIEETENVYKVNLTINNIL